MTRISVVAGWIERAGCVLLQRRPAGKPRAGQWEFPGGKRRDAETPEAALARELKEELGADAQVFEKLSQVDWEYPDVAIALALYAVHLATEPVAQEGQTLAWVRREVLAGTDLCAADVQLLAAL